MVADNRRCLFCNWLNKEVNENFTCQNCGKQNTVELEEIKSVTKKLKKSDLMN